MRITLAVGLCLIACAAVASPRAKDAAKPDNPITAQTREFKELRLKR